MYYDDSIEDLHIDDDHYGEHDIHHEHSIVYDDPQQHQHNVDSHQVDESSTTSSSMMAKLQDKLHHFDNNDVSFTGVKSTDAEIDKMKHDVSMLEHEVSCRKSDVSNWESKVSLNNTDEHKAKGDYANAVSHLNEAKSRYNNALDRLNAAKAKLNNAT